MKYGDATSIPPPQQRMDWVTMAVAHNTIPIRLNFSWASPDSELADLCINKYPPAKPGVYLEEINP